MRWFWPSWVSACIGALIAGVVEGTGMSSPLGIAVGAGFVILAAVPLLLAASLAARAVWQGWGPAVRSMIEPHGGAPRLAAWICVLLLAAVGLASGSYAATWMLARLTMFRALVVGYAMPVLVVALVGLLFIAARPVVRLLAALFARRGAALRPRRIAAAFGALVAVTLVVLWLVLSPSLGPLDLSPLLVPLVGVSCMIAAHAVLRRLTTPWPGRIASGLVLALATTAVVAWRTKPALTLEVWGELPVAGFVIDRTLDLSAIRDEISLATFKPVARPDAKHPDIVVIVVDTLRADRTPMHGGPAQMQFTGGLAARGALFEQARAPSNVTRRSIPSMLIGEPPDRIRGRVVGWALRIDPRHVVLAERLSAGGYDTAGFVCCGGFYGEESRTGLSRGLDHVVIEKDGAKLAKLARSWIETRERARPDKPLFVYMHLLDPHNWAGGGDPPLDAAVRMRMYDRTLSAADKMIGDTIAAFRLRDPGSAPIVIITADHGEALGDHGEAFHSTDLYDSQIHVPLSVTGPGIPQSRITETVSLTALAPTVIELAGFTPPPGSLAPLITGARPVNPDGIAYAAMIKDRSSKGGVSMIMRGRWKLIVSGSRRELYDVVDDPREATDRAAQQPQIVRELAALLDER